MSYHFSFVPGKESFFELMERAKRVGIRVLPTGKIMIRRRVWNSGESRLAEVSYSTFKEALRSFRHIYPSSLARAIKHRETLNRFNCFRERLKSPTPDSLEKRRLVIAEFVSLISEFSGVRCQNLTELRAHLKDTHGLTACLAELLGDKNWGAACCKIIYQINPRLRSEHSRILGYQSRIRYKEQLLGKIWMHDRWILGRVRGAVIEFGKHYDQVEATGEGFLSLVQELASLVEFIVRVEFDFRMRSACENLKAIQKSFLAAKKLTLTAKTELRRAQFNLRNYQRWLELEDSYEDMTPERQQYFVGVV